MSVSNVVELEMVYPINLPKANYYRYPLESGRYRLNRLDLKESLVVQCMDHDSCLAFFADEYNIINLDFVIISSGDVQGEIIKNATVVVKMKASHVFGTKFIR